jgi:hypothetical protein
MVFKYRPGFSAPVDPQTLGDRLESIRQRDEVITPAAVVDDARPKDAPLHPCFEWNNREAAGLYREDQARRLIRSVEVVEANDRTGEETRQIAFVSVAKPYTPGPAYTSTVEALSDEELRGRVMDECRRQLRGLQARYRQFQEIARAIQVAIDELECVPA